MVPVCRWQNASVPVCQSARVPKCQGEISAMNHDVSVPKCHCVIGQSATEPTCQGARVPVCRGAKVAEWMPGRHGAKLPEPQIARIPLCQSLIENMINRNKRSEYIVSDIRNYFAFNTTPRCQSARISECKSVTLPKCQSATVAEF